MSTDLRSLFLKSNPFKSKVIEVSVPQAEGEPLLLSVRIKQPSVEERNAIFAEARVNKAGEVNAGSSSKTGALAIVYCCRHPETDEPVFTVADIDTLTHVAAGSWVDSLASQIMDLLVDAAASAKK